MPTKLTPAESNIDMKELIFNFKRIQNTLLFTKCCLECHVKNSKFIGKLSLFNYTPWIIAPGRTEAFILILTPFVQQ